MGRRRNEEPEWDSTDDGGEDSDGSSVQESAFSDEDSESGSEGSETGSEGSDYSETGSEGSEDYSESEDSDSQSGSSEDSDESSDESDSGLDESMESIDYDDEQGIMGKDRGSMGSLYNNPTAKPKWAKFVPSKIMDKGQSAALVFCLCIILIPLSLIIGLSVGLTRGKDEPEPTPAPTKAPTAPPTAPPTAAEVIRAAVLSSEATNTIYRSGILADVTNGEEETILVQNGPPGDVELPSAYSLVQFDGIVGVDGDSASVDEYLGSIEGLMVEFCLTVADEEVSGKNTFTTCLLPPDSVPSSLDGLSGQTAPSYSIPADCLNQKTVDFEVDTTSEQVCINVAPLLTSGMSTTDTTADGPENPKLRGRRQLEKETGVNVTYLFMIDTLEESDQAGTKFYSSKASEDLAPSLNIEGENTCKSAAQIACRRPEFKELCTLGKQGELENILDSNQQLASKTVFAPINTAFDSLAKDTKEALGDTSTLIKTLQYHIAEKKIMSTDLECSAETNMIVGSTTTLCGSNGQFYQVGTGVSPGVNRLPKIIAADIETCYGVMHVVDQVLIPADPKAGVTCISAEANQTVADLCEQPEYTMMCSMIKTAGLADVLSNGLYTIFAPTDDAFNKALQALGASVNFTDTGLVTDVVLGHTISGSAIYAEDLECDTEVEMANGQKHKITCNGDAVFVSGPGNDNTSPPEIVEKDTLACNLVVHRVDQVILPSLGGDNVVDDDEVFPSCGICGAGLIITLSDETIEIPDSVGLPAQSGGVTCGMADKFCRSGACSPETCTAFADGISGACGCKESPTVVDVLAGEDSLSSVYSLVESADLVGTLGDPQEEITIFAPQNGGFKTLEETSPGFIAKLQENDNVWKTHLMDFLFHHVVGGIYAKSDLTDLTKVNAINGEKLTLRTNQNKKVFVNEARIEIEDLTGDNGVVHAIEDVLLPAWVDTTVVDVLGAKSKLSAVNDFLRQANLADALSGEGPFTVFAPTNKAIEQALQAFAGIGLDDSNTIALILNYHVVSGIYPASALSDGLSLTTLSEEDLIFNVVDSTVTVNGNKISSTDNLANNGIVHVIDGFLMPPALAPGGGGEMQPDGAATQSCSICSGEFGDFTIANPDSIITLPDGINISTIESSEVTCSLLEQACQIGFCDATTCQTLASQDTKDTCGCSE